MRAEIEDVLGDGDLLEAERVAPDRRHRRFHVARGGNHFAPFGGGLGKRQGLAIDLAVRRHRHPLKDDDLRGPHELRQLVGQPRPQVALAGRRVARRDVGEEPHVVLAELGHLDRNLADRTRLGDHRLDLAELDAVAADLHLVVGPAQEIQRAVALHPHQIAGPIPALAVTFDEAFGRQFGPPPIAARYAGAGDPQFAFDLTRGDLAAGRAHAQVGIGDRLAERHPLAHRVEPGDRRPDRRLGGPVHVEQPPGEAGPQLAGEVRRQRLAADHQAFELLQGAPARRVGGEIGGHRRRALQVGDAVLQDVLGHRTLVADAAVLFELAHQRADVFEVGQHGFGLDAEVDQTGDLIDPRRRHLAHDVLGGLRRAEQAGLAVVPLEGVIQQRVEFFRRQVLALEDVLRAAARGLSARDEGREGPRGAAHQVDGAVQVGLHRLARGRQHGFLVFRDEGVEHQHDVAGAIEARLGAGLPIAADLRLELLDRLAEQVGEHPAPEATGLGEGLDIACRGDPDRNFLLHRARMDVHGDQLAVRARELHRLARPQPAKRLHGSERD